MKSKDFLKVPVTEISSLSKYYMLVRRKKFIPKWFFGWLIKSVIQVKEWPTEELK